MATPPGVPPFIVLRADFGAPSGIRTLDPLIKSQLLYQLSQRNMGEFFFGGCCQSLLQTIQGCMKVSHTLLNSVNPIRLSRNELDVSNHLIRIITLTRGIVLMNPLPWVCLMLFIHEQTDRGIKEPFGWYWWWDSNPQNLVPKTNAYAIPPHQHVTKARSYTPRCIIHI